MPTNSTKEDQCVYAPKYREKQLHSERKAESAEKGQAQSREKKSADMTK